MSGWHSLTRMLAVDFRCGALEVAGRFAVATLLMSFVVASFKFLNLNCDGSFVQLSFIDCYASLFGGMGEFEPLRGESFNMPAAWLGICLMGAFAVLSYPGENLQGIGVKQCIEARGRWCWWASKCIWTTAMTFAYWVLAICISWVASGEPLPTDGIVLSRQTPELLGFFAARSCEAYEGAPGVVAFVLGTPFALSALYLIQLAVAVNVNPLAAFAVTATVLFRAAYYLSAASLGNYLMLARSDCVINNGVNPMVGIALSIVIAVMAFLLGGSAFSRCDLLGKEMLEK